MNAADVLDTHFSNEDKWFTDDNTFWAEKNARKKANSMGLLAGPATNLATLAVLKKTLGAKAAVVHISVLAVMTLAFGWLVDAQGRDLLTGTARAVSGHAHEHGGFSADLLGSVAAILLLGLIGAALWRGAKGEDPAADAAS